MPSRQYFRVMYHDNNIPKIGSGACMLGPSPLDLKIENGNVLPENGISISGTNLRNISHLILPERLGEGASGDNNTAVFSVVGTELQNDRLKIHPMPPKGKREHAEVCAREQIPTKEYEKLIGETQSRWKFEA